MLVWELELVFVLVLRRELGYRASLELVVGLDVDEVETN